MKNEIYLDFLLLLLGTLTVNLLETASTGQGILIRAGEGTIRAAQNV